TAGARRRGRDDNNSTGHIDLDSRHCQSRLGYQEHCGRGGLKVSKHLRVRFAGFARLFGCVLLAAACAGTAHAQQKSFTWEQIRDTFLKANPTLRAQAQSIESNRAGEITAGLRPNPQLQNDTTSATAGIYQEIEIGGKRSARIKSARL